MTDSAFPNLLQTFEEVTSYDMYKSGLGSDRPAALISAKFL